MKNNSDLTGSIYPQIGDLGTKCLSILRISGEGVGTET